MPVDLLLRPMGLYREGRVESEDDSDSRFSIAYACAKYASCLRVEGRRRHEMTRWSSVERVESEGVIDSQFRFAYACIKDTSLSGRRKEDMR